MSFNNPNVSPSMLKDYFKKTEEDFNQSISQDTTKIKLIDGNSETKVKEETVSLKTQNS